MKHLHINLLGQFQTTLDSQPITSFESNKVRALLAYLAVEADRPHARDELIGLLAIPAAFIGGLESPEGAILGGLLIGLVESIVSGRHVTVSPAAPARIFRSVPWTRCGEMVAEHRVQVRGGQFLCIPCVEESEQSPQGP